MVQFRVPVPDDIARQFDAVVARTGGRAATLGRVINAVADHARLSRLKGQGQEKVRVDLSLFAQDVVAIDAEAAAFGMTRNGWMIALVRRRIQDRPTFTLSDELTLIAILTQLRRIGVEISQVTHAMSLATTSGEGAGLDWAYLEGMRAEIRDCMRRIREAFDGNLAYWDAAR